MCPAFDQDGPAGVRAIDLDPGIRGERDPCGLQAQAQILAQEVQHDPLGVPLLGGTPRRRRVTGILTDGHAGRGARLHGPCLGEIRSFTILWSEPRKRRRTPACSRPRHILLTVWREFDAGPSGELVIVKRTG